MKQLNHRFEHWYRLTHWMSPELTKRSDDSYENEAVQAMYIAYRAGFNRANKERKEMYSADDALLRQALEALEAASSCLDGYYVPLGKTNIPEAEEAIAALRERLGEKT